MSRFMRCLTLFGGLATLCLLVPASAPAGHVRPKAASPSHLSLVPAFSQCIAPNRTHGPPLGFPSCSPPAQSSNAVTVGSPDANGASSNSTGYLRMKVIAGAVGPPDDSDVRLSTSVTDVRCATTTACGAANAAGGADYTGEVQESVVIRITDHCNDVEPSSVCFTIAATVVDVSFPRLDVPCVATASTSVGAVCSSDTTANALLAGVVTDAKRAIWQLEQVDVFDGGSDGEVDTTADNTVFLRPGVFIP